jgi:hypothetical protein
MLLLLSALCNAQDTIRYPVNEMKGIRIGIDNSKLIFPLIFKGERIGFEITADMHVKGNFFAVSEAGWLHVNLNREDFHYNQNGFYGKVGIDYNLLKQRRPNSNDIVYAGVRYAFSTFNQQAKNVFIPGHFWEDATGQIIPKNHMNVHSVEILLGVKAEVLTNLYVGLTFRGKFLLTPPKDKYSTPYLIPGYGFGNTNFVVGINHYVSYNIFF